MAALLTPFYWSVHLILLQFFQFCEQFVCPVDGFLCLKSGLFVLSLQIIQKLSERVSDNSHGSVASEHQRLGLIVSIAVATGATQAQPLTRSLSHRPGIMGEHCIE